MKNIILVTGSTSGLGLIIAEKLESKGFIVYRGDRKAADTKHDNDLILDITNDKNCSLAIKTIVEKEGKIDGLINVAGYTLVGPTDSFSHEEYLKILNTNTVGAFRLIKEVITYFKKQKNGKIINITSLNGILSLPNFGLYSSSKFALEALGLALRYELNKHNIWVTNVTPGAIANKGNIKGKMPHKTLREKSWLAKVLMPMVTREQIADEIEKILINPTPPARVILGNDAIIASFLQKLLPLFIWDKIMLYVWNKK